MSKAPDIRPDVPTLTTLDATPFKRLVLSFGAVPEDFKDSMAYYEMLAWLCDFIANKLMPAIDGYSEKYNELITAFNDLKAYCDNYFKNLDVQEEINNKLDEMAEDGSLERIIARYLDRAVIVRDSISEFASDEDIAEGVIVKTLGYYSVNDGGGSYYLTRAKDVSDTDDGGSIIFLQNDLVGVLMCDKTINVKQFGAKADGTTDDRLAIQNAINYMSAKGGGTVYAPTGTYLLGVVPYYKLDETQRGVMSLMLFSNIKLCGEEGTIFTIPDNSWGAGAYYRMVCTHEETRPHDITIENITLDGNGANETNTQQASNILLCCTANVRVNNVHSLNCNGNGIMVRGLTTEIVTNVRITNCVVKNCTKIGIQCSHFKDLTITDNQISDTTDNGIDVYGNDGDNHVITSSQFVISNNVISNTLAGIFPETVENGVVDGNSISHSNTGVKVNSINAQTNNVHISDNQIEDCGVGIAWVGPQIDNYAVGNTISAYTTAGMTFQTTNRQTIRDNIFAPRTANLPVFSTSGDYANHISAMHNYVRTLGVSGVEPSALVRHGATTETSDIFVFENLGTYLWQNGGSKVNNQYFQINIPTDRSWRGKFLVKIGTNQIAEIEAVYVKGGELQVGTKSNIYLATGASDDITQIRAYSNVRFLVYTTSSTSIQYQLQLDQEWL